MTSIQDGRPLKVALFGDSAKPGDELYELARDLAAEAVEVDVFSLRRDDERAFEAADGFRIHRSGAMQLERPWRLQSGVAPKLPPQAYAELRANRPDVIHAYGTSFAALVAGGVARLLKRPLITTVRPPVEEADALAKRLPAIAYEKSLARALVRGSDRVICRGLDATANAERLGARPEATTVLPADASVHVVLGVYVDALAERELRWFLQEQVA